MAPPPLRPPSSAYSSHALPQRPTTSAGMFHHSDHYPSPPPPHDYDIEEEYEDSEDDDVFAFLPSPGAKEQSHHQQFSPSHFLSHQQQQQLQHQQAQQHAQSSSQAQVYPQSTADSTPYHNHQQLPPKPATGGIPQASTVHTSHTNASTTSPLPAAGITYPSPTFDPYARFPADSLPQRPTSKSVPATSPAPSNTPTYTYHLQPPPQSPPSTDSHNHDDPFRLRRLNTAVSSMHHPESREVRVSLPSTATSGVAAASTFSPTGTAAGRPTTAGGGASIVSAPLGSAGTGATGRSYGGKRSAPSIAESMSLTPSMIMMDDDDATSRDGSIK
ncbi:hypothetical protein AMATHDRAFT_50724 [Amanita thiersii Skay4041]|uniref:Uncharacterized protein n=1 Tax=Amanita thiersii Skay4041 TaxID=703135 RepID=A0A2A9NGH0_9AGAR|nr:hypothetical protein AMATHDRAFT_50724 [Amanita thiersii Skay4041]